MLEKVLSPIYALFAFLCAMLFSVAARAQTSSVDVSATVSSLGDVKTAVLAIGVAVLAIVVGIKLYKWVKQAL